jgi:hypothetical protein
MMPRLAPAGPDPGLLVEAPLDPDSDRGRRPKDRLIQARVSRDLDASLRREARRRRLTVSHLIRNILEDTFQLVDDVVANMDELVTDSVELARRVGDDARRVARAVRGERPDREAVRGERADLAAARGAAPDAGGDGAGARDEAPAVRGADALGWVVAWNRVVLQRATACVACGRRVARGAEAWLGLGADVAAGGAWLCTPCVEGLRAHPTAEGSEGEGS